MAGERLQFAFDLIGVPQVSGDGVTVTVELWAEGRDALQLSMTTGGANRLAESLKQAAAVGVARQEQAKLPIGSGIVAQALRMVWSAEINPASDAENLAVVAFDRGQPHEMAVLLERDFLRHLAEGIQAFLAKPLPSPPTRQ